jgi:hypothetical protein
MRRLCYLRKTQESEVLISKRRFIESGVVMVVAAGFASLITRASAQSAAPPQNNIIPQDVLDLIDPASGQVSLIVNPIDFGSATYYVVEVINDTDDTGEPLIIRKRSGGSPVVLPDFEGVPQSILLSDDVIDVDIQSLSERDRSSNLTPRLSIQQATAAQDKAIYKEAESASFDSSEAPKTGRGRRACVWAVNRVVRTALRRNIADTLRTSDLYRVLSARHVPIPEPVPGCIVISPTVYHHPKATIGHVCIVGQNSKIFSNSARYKKWMQNYDISTWNRKFAEKLGVAYFRLDDVYFPKAPTRE